ncbi:ATP-binding protein [Actinosynnema sp. NPDC050801]|uniref:NACHT and WD repeat domain-containing protein n=1 Tax=unclassified Actinosynnema TaxID=2637065 RepID=UPI0033FAB45B
MPSPDRVFFLAGVGTYNDSKHNLPLVPEELREMREVLTFLGFQDGAPHLADQPDIDPHDLKDALYDWVRLRAEEQEQDGGELREPPSVFIYVTGHGYQPEESPTEWFLTGREYDPDTHKGLLRSGDLIRPFVKKTGIVDEVMLVLDSCMSEGGSVDAMDQVHNEWEGVAGSLRLWILSSSYREQLAGQTTFVQAFRHAALNGGRSREHLPVKELCGRINQSLSRQQQATALSTSRTGPGRVLPNPSHMPQQPPDWLSGEWHEWSAVARGLRAVDQAGWFFTGRDDVLVDLVAVLDPDEMRPAPHLVVGGMGSGKSALLGRLVLAGMPGSRMPPIARHGHLPRPGAVQAALRIREPWSVDDIATRLADQLGVQAGTPAQLLAALAGRPGPIGIVLDDVDRCEQPEELTAALIAPLAATGVVRLVMSARQPVELGRTVRVVDLDSAHPADVRELADYLVFRATRTDGAPLAGREDEVRSVTLWVAPMCASNFGIAALVANDLIGPQTHKRWVNETSAKWRKRVGELVFGLFRQAVENVVPEYSTLFAPLRLDGHEWLPESLWIDLAAAPGVHRHTPAEIEAVAAAAGALLDRKVVDGQRWWRLRVPPPSLDWPVQDVTNLLLAVVPTARGRRQWSAAHPELARLLVRSAASDATTLETVLADQELLVNTLPVPIVGDDDKRVPKPGIRTKALLEAWHSLHVGAMTTEAKRLVLTLLVGWRKLDIERVDVGGSSARVDWAVQTDPVHGAIVQLAVNRHTAVAGHDDGSATLWSLSPHGGPRKLAADEGEHLVSALAVAPSDEPLAVVARRGGRVTVVAADGGDLPPVKGGTIESMAFADATTVAFTHQSSLSYLDVETGVTRRAWAPVTLKLDRVAVGTPERPALVVGTRSGDVLVRDHARQTVTGVLHRGEEAITALCTSPDGDTVAVVGAGGALTVHRLSTHEQVARLSINHPARVAVSDRWLLVAEGGRRPSLVVHDLDDRAARVLELVLPNELTGVGFVDDGTVVLAASDGMAHLTLDRAPGGTDEG